ncbi:hypothetical protein RRG08_025496 [Elysia crispata]|uniref:Uncharacterized protein n=1 Tax=Elysia crispata TaxID=231223 RepID=A0AAE1CQX4_9GAST|nr:hypothetical protein RRG08_025496 [Elysia crispata]
MSWCLVGKVVSISTILSRWPIKHVEAVFWICEGARSLNTDHQTILTSYLIRLLVTVSLLCEDVGYMYWVPQHGTSNYPHITTNQTSRDSTLVCEGAVRVIGASNYPPVTTNETCRGGVLGLRGCWAPQEHGSNYLQVTTNGDSVLVYQGAVHHNMVPRNILISQP